MVQNTDKEGAEIKYRKFIRIPGNRWRNMVKRKTATICPNCNASLYQKCKALMIAIMRDRVSGLKVEKEELRMIRKGLEIEN